MMNGHDETWSAETTLHGALCHESFLHICQRSVCVESFDCRNLGFHSGGGQDKTAAHSCSVYEHSATAAFTLFAGSFRARKPEALAQDIKEAFANPCIRDVMFDSVYFQ
jgi:hypothetical protein